MRVRITNSRLNSYGTRVLTEGVDTSQYERNPVLLDMHQRGQVIGFVKDIRHEGDDITGEIVFDEATELSRQRKRQYEFGSLRMVSAGLEILELSRKPEHLVEGQTRPTISRSKLFEVSCVDIGANDDAIRFYHPDGQTISLGWNASIDDILPRLEASASVPSVATPSQPSAPVPSVAVPRQPQATVPCASAQDSKNINLKTQPQMELKDLAIRLGLSESATEAEVFAKLDAINAGAAKQAQLQAQLETLQKATIEAAVAAAIDQKKLSEDKRQHFIDLGLKIGSEELSKVLDAMQPQIKLSAIVGHQGGPSASGNPSRKWSDLNSDELVKLRKDRPDEYVSLFKQEFGFVPDLNED